MFVEHFIRRVPKAVQIAFCRREGSKLLTLLELWITFSGYFNHYLERQETKSVSSSHVQTDIHLQAGRGPAGPARLPGAVPPSIFPVSSHRPAFPPHSEFYSPGQNVETENENTSKP